MATVLDTVRALVTPDVTARAASLLGESESGVSRGLGAAITAVLSALLGKTSDSGAMRQIMSLLTDPSIDSVLARNIPGMLSAGGLTKSPATDLGSRFLSAIFGDRLGPAASALAENAGVKSSTASTLLGLASPLVMSVLGDRVRREGLDAAGLGSLLGSQRDSILAAAPAALSGLLGLGTPRGLPREPIPAPSAWGGSRAWLGAALAGVALLALWAWARRPGTSEVAQAPLRPPAGQTASLSVTDLPDAALFKRRLASNYDLSAPANGIEKQLVVFIEDPAKGVDTATWFNFDRLLFETNSATLKPTSEEQLRNVAEILKSYPNVKVKVGGYTDNTGDPAANQKLSQDRATVVVTELVRLGIPAERLSAEGYGQQYPVADNSTEEGRAQNRRIAMRVTGK
jgi:outer membrane protein OmpA-like peptidoglycan-associated protein